MKDRSSEDKPVRVPERAKQAGDTVDQRSVVEPNAWTEALLTAPCGVKGGV